MPSPILCSPPMPFSFKPDSPWATPLPHQTECAATLNDPMMCDQSGIVTLPCGSGKTRIAFEQALQCKKVLFLSYELTGVEQFKHALLTHTNVDPRHVLTLTGSSKANPSKSICFLSTSYGILTSMETKSEKTQSIVKSVLTSIPWDLIVCDEVHHSPANAYQHVLKTLMHNQPSSGKVLGITATLVRKASTTDDPHTVFDFIGPVLFEKSWKQMEEAKVVSKLDFVGVSTSMDAMFALAHEQTSGLTQSYIATLPSNKMIAIWNITRLHLLRGHVGIVFCDHIFPAEQVVAMLGEGWFLMRGFIYEHSCTDGGSSSSSTSATNVLTSVEDRMKLKDRINAGDPLVKGIVATQVADAALDIHHADFCYGVSVDASSSEATNAQRAGRIMRNNSNAATQKHAYFYDLITTGTSDVGASQERRRFMVDEGYNYTDTDPAFFEETIAKAKTADVDKVYTCLATPCPFAESHPDHRAHRLALLVEALRVAARAGGVREGKKQALEHKKQHKLAKQDLGKKMSTTKSSIFKDRHKSGLEKLKKQTKATTAEAKQIKTKAILDSETPVHMITVLRRLLADELVTREEITHVGVNGAVLDQ